MDARALGEVVGYIDPQFISFDRFESGAMHSTIESPTLSPKSWCELMFDFFRDQIKYFNLIDHFIWKRRSVWCDDRCVIATRFAWWECLVWTRLLKDGVKNLILFQTLRLICMGLLHYPAGHACCPSFVKEITTSH